jgi:DNA-binding beta-propeller fold protein YncE
MIEGPRRTTLLYLASAGIALLASTASCSSCEEGAGGASGSARSGGPIAETTPGKHVAIPQARAAYVTNNGSDSIGVIDRDSEGGVDAVPIDLDPDAHEAPHHLALDPASRSLFVALAFPPSADPSKKKKDPHASHGNAGDPGKLARLDLATLAVNETHEVDENPGDVVLTHDRSRVLVTHFDMKRAMDVAARGGGSPATMFAELLVFDARDMKKLAGRPICVAPHGVATTKDDRTAFVACYGSDELAVVDLAAPGHALPTSRHPLGASPGVPGVPRYGPYSATLSPDEALVVLADVEGQDVRVWDRAKKVFLPDKTVPLSAKAFMPAFVGPRALLVPTQAPDGLARIDLETAKVVRRASFDKKDCMLPHVVSIAGDGRAYLVCEGDHSAPGTVLEIDPETLATKKKWTVGVYPDGIAFGGR